MSRKKFNREIDQAKNERGAALVTVLMISLVLLVACTGVLLESSMNAANVTDAVSEEQAYVAAESGIQSAINVLRGNVVPNPLLDATVVATNPNNLISFRRALKPATSNLSSDTATTARLSRWLGYDNTYNDRITMGSNYAPRTGMAFGISLSDPDATGDSVTYKTAGKIDNGTNFKTYSSGLNGVSFTYNQRNSTTYSISGETINVDLGNFSIAAWGTGFTFTQDVKFEILVTMTDPYEASRVLRGYFRVQRDSNGNPIATTVTPSSMGGLKILFDSPTYVLNGANISLLSGSESTTPPGYLITPVLGTNTVNATITAAEPLRILITSTGYGPRGSKKILEAMVQKNFFNGMSAPATLTLVGSSTGFAFSAGQSQNVTYSGDDVSSNVVLPPVGTTNDANLGSVNTEFATSGRKADVFGAPANVSAELPSWLSNPANLDATIQSLRSVAQASGRYYDGTTNPPNIGNNATGKGITFVDGDLQLNGSGGGIMIVTGDLQLKGNFSFNGMIIVTGTNGVSRSGGGNGTIQGNVVIAPYDPGNLSQPFLAPHYDISGGGNSTIVYNSNSVGNGMMAVSNFVLGVAEK